MSLLRKIFSARRRWGALSRIAASSPDAVALLPRCGVGDFYYVAALHRKFESTHGIKAAILCPHTRYEVVSAFVQEDRIVRIPDGLARGAAGWRMLRRGRLFYAHFYPWEPKWLMGSRAFTLQQAYLKILNLDPNAALPYPVPLSRLDIAGAKQMLVELGATERTVIAFPSAISTPGLGPAWAGLLRNVARDRGWTVLWNSPPEGRVPGDIVLPQVPLQRIRALCACASLIVAVRSGICEWISSTPVNQLVLYPDISYYGRPFQTNATLRGLPGATYRTEVRLRSQHDIETALRNKVIS